MPKFTKQPEPEPSLAEQAQALPNPPDLPAFRTFEVKLPPNPTVSQWVESPVHEVIEAHSIELAGNGALLFFDYENQMNDKTGRWGIAGRMRRALAPGQWRDVKEMMIPSNHKVTN